MRHLLVFLAVPLLTGCIANAWPNRYDPVVYAVVDGRVVPAAAQQGECREYDRSVTIDGRQHTVHGLACRRPDGSWQTVR